jgi:hypothetical protein
VIELGRFAQDGPLRQFLVNSPSTFAENGAEGVALSYDGLLVEQAVRTVSRLLPDHFRGTIEFSHLVALLLAGVGERFERGNEDVPLKPFVDDLCGWWIFVAGRRDVPWRKPIVVEITVGPETSRAYPVKDSGFGEAPYRLAFRRSAGSVFQAAASGGRIIPERSAGKARAWGTVGGFLVDPWSDRIWAMTAAHVSEKRDATAQPTLLPGSIRPLRELARIGLNLGAVAGYRRWREVCPFSDSSEPDIVVPNACTASHISLSTGLDVALHEIKGLKRPLSPVAIASTSDLSQGLQLSFVGATSGFKRATVSSYSIWHSYKLDNGTYACVHDCIQLRPVGPRYVREALSQGGDSGAWLLARGLTQSFWVGLLTGGDGDRTGIVRAERIFSHFGHQGPRVAAI